MLSFHFITKAETWFKNYASHRNSCDLKLQTYTLQIAWSFCLQFTISSENSLLKLIHQIILDSKYEKGMHTDYVSSFLNVKKYLRDPFLKQIELYYSVKNSYHNKYKIAVVLYNLVPF